MDVGAAGDATITHSICEQCIKKIEKQMADRQAAKFETQRADERSGKHRK
jgi:hypothetical protein